VNPSQWDVAPHGLVMLAAVALLFVILIHTLGFRVVGAIKVGR
jgi:hypothetical protein